MDSITDGDPRELERRHRALLRDALLDSEIVVTDAQADVDRAVVALQLAVRRRDELARKVMDLTPDEAD